MGQHIAKQRKVELDLEKQMKTWVVYLFYRPGPTW